MNEFEILINKLKKALSIENDKEIAELLGFTSQSFSERKRRNSIPITKIEKLIKDKNIDRNVIFNKKNEENEEENKNFDDEILAQSINAEVLSKNIYKMLKQLDNQDILEVFRFTVKKFGRRNNKENIKND